MVRPRAPPVTSSPPLVAAAADTQNAGSQAQRRCWRHRLLRPRKQAGSIAAMLTAAAARSDRPRSRRQAQLRLLAALLLALPAHAGSQVHAPVRRLAQLGPRLQLIALLLTLHSLPQVPLPVAPMLVAPHTPPRQGCPVAATATDAGRCDARSTHSPQLLSHSAAAYAPPVECVQLESKIRCRSQLVLTPPCRPSHSTHPTWAPEGPAAAALLTLRVTKQTRKQAADGRSAAADGCPAVEAPHVLSHASRCATVAAAHAEAVDAATPVGMPLPGVFYGRGGEGHEIRRMYEKSGSARDSTEGTFTCPRLIRYFFQFSFFGVI